MPITSCALPWGRQVMRSPTPGRTPPPEQPAYSDGPDLRRQHAAQPEYRTGHLYRAHGRPHPAPASGRAHFRTERPAGRRSGQPGLDGFDRPGGFRVLRVSQRFSGRPLHPPDGQSAERRRLYRHGAASGRQCLYGARHQARRQRQRHVLECQSGRVCNPDPRRQRSFGEPHVSAERSDRDDAFGRVGQCQRLRGRVCRQPRDS